ncbi:MAG TPA: PHB depolymerase family esterase [Micropepsaceae bacterium]|nr:PHB depolymerase family esterase [Micropepsaceae bacterium]
MTGSTAQRLGIGAAAAILLAAALYWNSGTGALAAQPNLTGTVKEETVAVKGGQRSFVLYVPRNLKPNAPFLFVFHGSGGDGASMRGVTAFEFDMLADRDGFLVAYPDGFQTTWNDCRKGSPQPARVMNIDDEGFVDAIIAKESAEHGIDKKRIFSAGWSNGGQLGYRFAMERANVFAGVAALSASVPVPTNLACTPSGAAMPVMIINGTADPINPFNGGNVMLGGTSLGPVYSSMETAQYWAKLNGITDAPAMKHLPHKNPSDPTSVDETTWSQSGKTLVVLYAVHGGGHVVPTRTPQDWGGLGRETGDLDAPVAIWDFFSKLPSHP